MVQFFEAIVVGVAGSAHAGTAMRSWEHSSRVRGALPRELTRVFPTPAGPSMVEAAPV